MSCPARFLVAALVLLATSVPSPALVFWNLGNGANQTDPGTGAPWDSVAKIINSNNTALSGSAVYLGNGFLLTANHVYVGPSIDLTNYSHVTFDDITTYAIDPTFGTWGVQVAPGVDMKVIKLMLDPSGVNAVSLLTTPTEAEAAATLVGWGVGRDPSAPLGSTNVEWDTNNAAGTADKRWGLNVPRSAITISYPSYSYDALVTIAGAEGPGFNPDGLGDAEAALGLFDSGSGLFQQSGTNWYLIGLGTAVETFNFTDFGNDQTNSPRGGANYFGRISSYHDEITLIVPEPSTWALLGFSSLVLGWAAARRRR